MSPSTGPTPTVGRQRGARSIGTVATVALVASLAACQGGDAGGKSGGARQRARTAPAAPVSGNAAVAGGVYLAGSIPPRSGPPVASDCLPPGAPVEFDPALVHASSGAIAGVIIWLREGAPAVPLPAEAAPVELAVDDCGFHPRTTAARVGQSLRLTNRGSRPRTVVARDDQGTLFEVTVAPGTAASTPAFERAAGTARLACRDEAASRAYVGVMEHPFFAVTDTTGSYVLPHLPGGTYAVAAWHEVLGQVVHRIAVEDGGMIIVDFPLQAAHMTGGPP